MYIDSFKTYTQCCNKLILDIRSLEYVELLKKVRSCKSSYLSLPMHTPDAYTILDIHDLGIKEKTKVNLISSEYLKTKNKTHRNNFNKLS